MIGALAACAPPSDPSLEASTGPTAASTGLASGPEPSSGSTSSGLPPSTFGMDGLSTQGADEGAEVGFVGPLDLACAAPPGSSSHCALCDVRAQGCLDGFRCVAWADDGGDAWNGTKCIGTALSPVGVGQACTVVDGPTSGRDDCAPGSMCWDVDPTTLEGVCVPFCAPEGDDPVCPAGTQCMIDGLQVLALCLPPCDPLGPDRCPIDAACRFLPDSDAGFCIPEQGGRVLSPTIQCGDSDQECSVDEVCITAANYGGCGSPTCCTQWCDLDAPDADAPCAAQRPDHACVPVFHPEPAPAGYERLGVCAVPAR